MSDISILKALLKSSARVALSEHPYNKEKQQLILTEDDPAGGYSVTIDGMPDDSEVVVIKVDEFVAPTAIFVGGKGECKRADFAIVLNDNDRKMVLYIELKARSSTSSEGEIIRQFKGARCFFAYCREIGKQYWEERAFLEGYSERFVSVRNISISKRESRMRPEKSAHDQPERMLKISSPHCLRLSHLT